MYVCMYVHPVSVWTIYKSHTLSYRALLQGSGMTWPQLQLYVHTYVSSWNTHKLRMYVSWMGYTTPRQSTRCADYKQLRTTYIRTCIHIKLLAVSLTDIRTKKTCLSMSIVYCPTLQIDDQNMQVWHHTLASPAFQSLVLEHCTRGTAWKRHFSTQDMTEALYHCPYRRKTHSGVQSLAHITTE